MINKIQSELKPLLDSDETLIWSGKPSQGLRLNLSDFFLIPFSLMWGGFAIYWEVNVLSIDSPLMFKIWGIPFVLIAFYMVLGRFFFDAKRREKTFYGITKNRIIIKTGVFKTTLKSIYIKTLSDLSIIEKSDKSGTIILGSNPGFSGMLRGTGWPGADNKLAPALEMIDQVSKVYKQITDLKKESEN